MQNSQHVQFVTCKWRAPLLTKAMETAIFLISWLLKILPASISSLILHQNRSNLPYRTCSQRSRPVKQMSWRSTRSLLEVWVKWRNWTQLTGHSIYHPSRNHDKQQSMTFSLIFLLKMWEKEPKTLQNHPEKTLPKSDVMRVHDDVMIVTMKPWLSKKKTFLKSDSVNGSCINWGEDSKSNTFLTG